MTKNVRKYFSWSIVTANLGRPRWCVRITEALYATDSAKLWSRLPFKNALTCCRCISNSSTNSLYCTSMGSAEFPDKMSLIVVTLNITVRKRSKQYSICSCLPWPFSKSWTCCRNDCISEKKLCHPQHLKSRHNSTQLLINGKASRQA